MEIENNVKKYVLNNRSFRLPGMLFIIFSSIYIIWLFFNINPDQLGLSIFFLITQTFLLFSASLSIYNHWNLKFNTRRPKINGPYPPVSVVIPTYKEPVEILEKTAKSVLNISYPGEVIVLISNDDQDEKQREEIENMMIRLSEYWQDEQKSKVKANRNLHLIHTIKHPYAKAGNLNQAVELFRKYYPHVDLILTQDADEIVSPDILDATVGYFTNNPNLAYVQTVKQAYVEAGDPFGNRDLMWYARTSAARESANSMFACGSGVVWRISAVESVGGFSTWNLVEDLTTSYYLLANGWESKYHYEALSIGLAPEDLANFIKQRGTWALDTMRIFFWDNPFFRNGLKLKQKLQFIELPIFYINGLFIIFLILITAYSLVTGEWPTTATSFEHAAVLLPGFISLELFYILLAGNIPQKRVRQFWIGLAPVYAKAIFQALLNGPENKPKYKVTAKTNKYANYTKLIIPQIILVIILLFGVAKTVLTTPLYSRFDWAIFFWGAYQATFFTQIISVSWWKWRPQFRLRYSLSELFGAQTNVSLSYKPDST